MSEPTAAMCDFVLVSQIMLGSEVSLQMEFESVCQGIHACSWATGTDSSSAHFENNKNWDISPVATAGLITELPI